MRRTPRPRWGLRVAALAVVGVLAVLAAASPALVGKAKTTRVSVSSSGLQGSDESLFPSISADGRFVAFESSARSLVRHDTNYASDVFVRDLRTGNTTRVNVSSSGRQTVFRSLFPSISADGRFVAFDSFAPNLVRHDTNHIRDVFVHDLRTGETRRVSVSSSGRQAKHGSFGSRFPSISANGRFVAFSSDASDLSRTIRTARSTSSSTT